MIIAHIVIYVYNEVIGADTIETAFLGSEGLFRTSGLVVVPTQYMSSQVQYLSVSI